MSDNAEEISAFTSRSVLVVKAGSVVPGLCAAAVPADTDICLGS